MVSMTTNLKITPSTTTTILEPKGLGKGRDYPVVPQRLVQIDGVDYVRCHLHGLIPLQHVCGDTPHDHWCREAAHPNYDPADGDQGLPNGEEISRLSERVRLLGDALLRACMYLDGFEFRLSWQSIDMWVAADLDARFGKDMSGKLTDHEWETLPWKAPTVKITTDPWDQYMALKRWADRREQPIRNVTLEKRTVPAPDVGWEPA